MTQIYTLDLTGLELATLISSCEDTLGLVRSTEALLSDEARAQLEPLLENVHAIKGRLMQLGRIPEEEIPY